MRFDTRSSSPIVLAGLLAALLGGCTGAPDQGLDAPIPDATIPDVTATPAPSGAAPDPEAGSTEFAQQLPLSGTFVSQWTETVGTVDIVRRADGTVWLTLTDFSTGTSPDLRLYLNEGAVLKNSDGMWTTDVGLNYEMDETVASDGTQEFEVTGAKYLTPIHSVSVMDYSAPDFNTYGSAPLE
jgi:hypothetical protein